LGRMYPVDGEGCMLGSCRGVVLVVIVVAERSGVRYLRKSPAVATSLVLDWSDHVGVAPIELGRGVHVKRLELFAKGSFQGLAFPHSGQHPEVGSAQLL